MWVEETCISLLIFRKFIYESEVEMMSILYMVVYMFMGKN